MDSYMNRKECLLSIIVPVYNTEKYIAQCLDSLLEQDIDKSEYEIICINDGSTDSSLSILREYEERYPNLVCVDKQNEGVSIARNMGLQKACGEYVWIIDADDWIARDCLGLIKRELNIHAPSVLQMHFDWIRAQWRVDECSQAKLQIDRVCCSVCGVSVLPYAGATTSIIKRSLLERYEHRFIEQLHYGEDVLFIRELTDRMRIEVELGLETHTMVHCQGEIFYYYRMHDHSAMHQSWTANRAKYMVALLQMARIDQMRMKDVRKPVWYRDQYASLFYSRMHNYMLHWLPAEAGDLHEHLERLREETLYPCPKPSKKIYQELTKAKGMAERIKNIYKYAAFRWSWLYPLYYKQMRKKYQK